MKIIDLSHPIHSEMPILPGSQPPLLQPVANLAEHGFVESIMMLYSHTGTHVDLPAHMLGGGATVTQLPLEKFTGKAMVLEVNQVAHQKIDLDLLRKHEESIATVEFLLLRTGFSSRWGEAGYLADYPTFTEAAADWLTTNFSLKGLGLDAVSVDEMVSKTFPIHQLLLQKGLVIYENLTNLEEISAKSFQFCGFPLKLEDLDASPVRAVAVCTE